MTIYATKKRTGWPTDLLAEWLTDLLWVSNVHGHFGCLEGRRLSICSPSGEGFKIKVWTQTVPKYDSWYVLYVLKATIKERSGQKPHKNNNHGLGVESVESSRRHPHPHEEKDPHASTKKRKDLYIHSEKERSVYPKEGKPDLTKMSAATYIPTAAVVSYDEDSGVNQVGQIARQKQGHKCCGKW